MTGLWTVFAGVGLAVIGAWWLDHVCRCCRWRIRQPHMESCCRCWNRIEKASREHGPAPAELIRETSPQFLRRAFTPAERYALDLEIDALFASERIHGEVDR